MPKKLNVVGLGNALMDVLVRIPTNDIIDQNNLTVGVMHSVMINVGKFMRLGDLSKEEQTAHHKCNHLWTLGARFPIVHR